MALSLLPSALPGKDTRYGGSGTIMAVGNLLRVAFQYRVQDKLCSWGTYYDVTAGDDLLSGASDLLTVFQSDVVPAAKDCLATDATFEGLYCSGIEPGHRLPARLNGRSTAGSDSGNSTPANLCAVFTLQTDDPAAKKHGRLYFSGISRLRLDNGLWEAGFLAAELSALATALGTTLTEAGKTYTPVTLQRIVDGSPVAVQAYPLVAVRVTQVPYTQRRRTTRQFGSGV